MQKHFTHSQTGTLGLNFTIENGASLSNEAGLDGKIISYILISKAGLNAGDNLNSTTGVFLKIFTNLRGWDFINITETFIKDNFIVVETLSSGGGQILNIKKNQVLVPAGVPPLFLTKFQLCDANGTPVNADAQMNIYVICN